MHRFYSRRNSNGKTAWIILIAIVIVVVVSFYIWKSKQTGTTIISDPAVLSDQNTVNEEPDAQHIQIPPKADHPVPPPSQPINEESKAKLEIIKAKQADAAKAAINAQPIDGTVSDRPEFVSEIEWDVLKGAVAQNEDVDVALTHFVNKLLFFKKREAWIDSSTDPETRRRLASELLTMIPQQLSEQAIDQKFADKMTADLNTFLSSDAQ